MLGKDKFLRLDERALYYFLAVYTYGSLRGAAEKLRLTPSAIGRKIQELEYQINSPLFERNARGSVPTAGAHMLAGHLRDRNKRDHRLLEEIAELHGLERGNISISTGEGFAYDLMQTVLGDFMLEHPGICIQLNVGGTEDIIDDILRDRADIAMAFNANRHPEIEVVAEAEDPLCAVVHADHPLARKSVAHLRELIEYPAALHSRHSGIRSLIERIQHEEGVVVPVRFETNSLHLLRMFVASNIGMTFFPRSAASSVIEMDIHAILLKDTAITVARNQLLTRKGRACSPAMNTLVRLAREKMSSFG